MQTKCKSRLKILHITQSSIDRKIKTVVSFLIYCMRCDKKEVNALDAKLLLDKLVERGLNLSETLEICERIYEPDKVTIGDAIWIKKKLGLSDLEAIEIFLQ